MAYATINPYTGETLQTFPDATDAKSPLPSARPMRRF
jgi:hypothetical protein